MKKRIGKRSPKCFFLFETFCTSFFFNYISSENVLLFFLQKKDKWDLQKIMSLFSNPDHVLKRPPLSELLGMEQSSSHIFVTQIGPLKQSPSELRIWYFFQMRQLHFIRVILASNFASLLWQLSFNKWDLGHFRQNKNTVEIYHKTNLEKNFQT